MSVPRFDGEDNKTCMDVSILWSRLISLKNKKHTYINIKYR